MQLVHKCIFLSVDGQTVPMEVLITKIVVYLSLSLFVALSLWAIYGIFKILNIPALGPDPKSEPENGLALPEDISQPCGEKFIGKKTSTK